MMSRPRIATFLSTLYLFLLAGRNSSQAAIQLVQHKTSAYAIVIPGQAGKAVQGAAALLQRLMAAATGATLPIVPETRFSGNKGIFIGTCQSTLAAGLTRELRDGAYTIATQNDNVWIAAFDESGQEHAVSAFAEQYMGCRKYDAGPVEIPVLDGLTLPDNIRNTTQPSFLYRESYYPMSADNEYLRWQGLQRFEDLWGLWGHSFFKLLPPAAYFSTHPEYFSAVNGQRTPAQLCLSQPEVLKLVIAALRQRMADNPDALYWSVSPNDGGGHCTCPLCSKADAEEGGPQGSLLRFVNKVAVAFPAKKITTLAYGATANAPLKTKPAANVYILLSSINAYREQALDKIPSAAGFRNQLRQWSAITDRIFVWDYATQFTHYLNPFPVLETIPANYRYLAQQAVKGIFEQGSGDTYADMAELNSYVQARLMWRPDSDVDQLVGDFCNGYYGAAAPYVLQYLQQRRQALVSSGRHLDIYGGPVADSKGFLAPALIDTYDQLLEKAESAVTDNKYRQRVQRIRLSLDYAVLQQSRYFGADPHGFLQDDGSSSVLSVKPGWAKKITHFVAAAEQAGVRELSEGGISPVAYGQEWQALLTKTWPRNMAQGATLSLLHPFVEDYPAKGLRTLTDGMTGMLDFSYNWLCFYGTDMVAVVDMQQSKTFRNISLHFLEDQRHWIFLPVSIRVEVSSDGVTYIPFGELKQNRWVEHTAAQVVPFTFSGTAAARFIRVTATNAPALPAWSIAAGKKPMIACDEIMVQP